MVGADLERIPPHSFDAEEGVIGSLLIDGDRLPEVMVRLTPQSFYREKNAWVYEAMVALSGRREGVNQVTVAHELAKKGRLEALGGPAYLSYLVANCPTSVHVLHYADVVARCALARQFIALGKRIEDIGYAQELSDEALAGAMKELSDFLAQQRRGKVMSPAERADFALARYARLDRLGSEAESVPFGLADLDEITGGAGRGDLVVVGARPRIGKSTLLQAVANHMGTYFGPVLFCNAEMSTAQFTDRDMVRLSGLSLRELIRGQYGDERWGRIQEGVASLSQTRVWVYDESPMTTVGVEAAARELQLKEGLVAIFVDYLQLLADLPGHKAYERVTYISGRLKQIARALLVPLVVASQLSRESEKAKRRPQLADLRESGAIEQDADLVLLLHREDAYFTQDEWRKTYKSRPYPHRVVDIKVAKQRQGGSIATIKAIWLPKQFQYGGYSSRGEEADGEE
jgi:replicative DNA helicase